jgi:hypothetical protein
LAGFELHDVVTRTEAAAAEYAISENLAEQAFHLGFGVVRNFLREHASLEDHGESRPDEAFARFKKALESAYQQGLIGRGGVPERNFLSLWLVANLMQPGLYVESGVFKGASLFAVASTSKAQKIVGFDPNPSAWRARLDGHDVVLERHQHDFSEHSFDAVPKSSLAYFDDHINSAKRILEAKEKGFRYLIFDDSCGLTGTSERVWPSLPSLFFIMNHERLREGDFLAWPKETQREITKLDGRLTFRHRKRSVQHRFEITREVIDLCRSARAVVAKCEKMPDLSDFIVTRHSIGVHDVTQHFVVLT